MLRNSSALGAFVFVASSILAALSQSGGALIGARAQSSAGAAIPGLSATPATAQVAEAAGVAFTDATRWAAGVAAGFLLLGLAASTSLSSGARKEEDELVDA